MSYLDMYSRRVLSNGTNVKEVDTLNGRRDFNSMLDNFESPTVHDVYVVPNGEYDIEKSIRVRCEIGDVSKNDKKVLDEKHISFRFDDTYDIGSYIKWKNRYWVLVHEDINSFETHRTFVMKKCNQILKYKYKGKIYNIPISIGNLTLYSDGLQDIRYTSTGDSKASISYGSNEITKTIDVGTRVMFTNKTTFRLTNINDYEYNGAYTGSDGLIKSLVLQTALLNNDDIENNIAWNPDSIPNELPQDNKINGEKFIYMGAKNKYSIVYTNNQIEWLLDNNYVFCNIISQNDNECVLESKPLANYVGASVNLIARDRITKNVIDMKTVMVRG